jgi:hypothetical protein
MPWATPCCLSALSGVFVVVGVEGTVVVGVEGTGSSRMCAHVHRYIVKGHSLLVLCRLTSTRCVCLCVVVGGGQ